MSQFSVRSLLATTTVTVRDVDCQGNLRHQSAEEHATVTQLVFPYRGTYVRHMGRDDLREYANGFLTVVALLNLAPDALRAQRFLHQKHVWIVVFDDENLCGLAWTCHPRVAVQVTA